MTVQYGTGVVVIPAAALGSLDRASVLDIRVLLSLCSCPDLTENYESRDAEGKSTLALTLGCTVGELEASVAFWRGAGILLNGDNGAEKSAEKKAGRRKKESAPQRKAESAGKSDVVGEMAGETIGDTTGEAAVDGGSQVRVVGPRRADSVPCYTTEELTALLEHRQEATTVIDESQRILGRIFNTREVNIILGLLDYLSLDGEYILLLCSYCARIGKKSLSYVEKTAFGLCEEGVDDVGLLQDKLRRMEAVRDAEGQVHRIFGMGERRMTPNESKLVKLWVDEWGFDSAMIERAYQVTVDTIGKPSMKYAGGVLERWHGDGITTPEQVDAREAAWQKNKQEAREAKEARESGKTVSRSDEQRGSFDTDDFFEAALRRSYGEPESEQEPNRESQSLSGHPDETSGQPEKAVING